MSNHKLVERDPEHYFKHRPRVPEDILHIAKSIYRKPIDLVVDLGSGPGNSTQDWTNVARHVIGVEPSKPLFDYAVRNKPENITYINCFAEDTGIDPNCVDIVTASSAIHWMEPQATTKEVLRILKNDGIFMYFAPHPPLIPFLDIEQQKNIYLKNRPKVNDKQLRYEWGGSPANHFLKKEFNYTRKFFISVKETWSGSDYLEWIKTGDDKRRHNLEDEYYITLKDKVNNLWKNHEEVVFTFTAWIFKDKINNPPG